MFPLQRARAIEPCVEQICRCETAGDDGHCQHIFCRKSRVSTLPSCNIAGIWVWDCLGSMWNCDANLFHLLSLTISTFILLYIYMTDIFFYVYSPCLICFNFNRNLDKTTITFRLAVDAPGASPVVPEASIIGHWCFMLMDPWIHIDKSIFTFLQSSSIFMWRRSLMVTSLSLWIWPDCEQWAHVFTLTGKLSGTVWQCR